MKYNNCVSEFDLKEIYRKLTAPAQPRMVKASEFFEQPKFSLAVFQKNMSVLIDSTKI